MRKINRNKTEKKQKATTLNRRLKKGEKKIGKWLIIKWKTKRESGKKGRNKMDRRE